jgi:hypothetical protein
VLYHSGPTFGQVSYSCLDAFVVDVSDYSGHLIRNLLNASEAFPTEWYLRNKSKSGGLSPPDFDLFPKLKWYLRNKSKSGRLSPPDFDLFTKLKKPLHGKRFRSVEEVSNEVT